MVLVLTAERDGWAAVRNQVLARDRGCIFRDRGYGECAGPTDLDHVKEQPQIGGLQIKKRADKHSYKAPDDEAHLVSVCAAHHRGERQVATSKEGRQFERDYLAERYPEVWD